LGTVSLRRRRLLSLGGQEVFEVKLGDAFLMSSLFHEAEVALANLALSDLGRGGWDVVIGGLGLGYTALAALENPSVRSVLVIEALAPVLDWHHQGLVPLGSKLTSDPRCRFVRADFFELAASRTGFDPANSGRRFHAVLLDIDHSPTNLLHPGHAAFYQPEGLRSVARHLHGGGVFAQWADGDPEERFIDALDSVFGQSRAHLVRFANPLLETESTSTIYLARKLTEAKD